jgi:hypothetical protein
MKRALQKRSVFFIFASKQAGNGRNSRHYLYIRWIQEMRRRRFMINEELLNKITFDKRYDDDGLTTLYFTAPKEILSEFGIMYEFEDDAIYAEISMEFPTENIDADHVLCYIGLSPTIETDDGMTDIDWNDIELSDNDINKLISLSQTYEQTIFFAENLGGRSFTYSIRLKIADPDIDIEQAIKDACKEYCQTDEGRQLYLDNNKSFNYGDFDLYVPDEICKKYGIEKISGLEEGYLHDKFEQLVDEEEILKDYEEDIER